MNSMISIINILALGFMAFLIWRRGAPSFQGFWWPALSIKLAAGIALGLIYTWYYQANDTFLFFNDAKVLAAMGRTDVLHYLSFLWSGNEASPLWDHILFVEPRTVFFIKALSLVLLATNDNYWIASLWFSFLSFAGCWYLFVRVNLFFVRASWPAAIALFFVPSFVFWSSGIIKESVATAAVCFISAIFLQLVHHQKVRAAAWLLMAGSLYALWSLKYYWAAVLIPTTATTLLLIYVVQKIIALKSKWIEAVVWLLVFLTLCLAVSFVHPNFYLERLLSVIVDNHNQFVVISSPQGLIHFYQLTPHWQSIAINAPWALLSGLFRPFLWEAHTWLQLMAAVENTLLLILLLSGLHRVKTVFQSPSRLVVYSAIVYVALLCIFLALSTPNFGTLSRYRIGFLPVFCLLILYDHPLWNRIAKGRK